MGDGEEQHTGKEDPLDGLVGEVHDRDECCAELERSVTLGMLEYMAALMGSHRGSGDVALPVNRFAEVHRLCLRVVMVRQGTSDRSDFHVSYSVVPQHLACYIGSCHAVAGRNLGVLVEPALKHRLDDVAEHHHADDDYPDHLILHILV